MSTVSIINRVPPNALSLGHWKNLLPRAGLIFLAQPKFYNSPEYLSLTYTFKLSSVMWLTALPFKVERGEEGHCTSFSLIGIIYKALGDLQCALY